MEVVCILFRQTVPLVHMLVLGDVRFDYLDKMSSHVSTIQILLFFPFVMNDLWDGCCLIEVKGWAQNLEEDWEIFGDGWNHLVLWLFEFLKLQSVVLLQWYGHLFQNASQPYCVWKALVWCFRKQSTEHASWVQADPAGWERWHPYMSSQLPQQFLFGFSKVV